MSVEPGFTKALGDAVRKWKEHGRLTELLSPLLDWLFLETRAERAAFVLVSAGGGFRARTSRTALHEPAPSPDSWISHFAVDRALEMRQPTFFADTRSDRRFRTEGDAERGIRTRSILVVPVVSREATAALYLDSRFQPMQYGDELEPLLGIAHHLLTVALELETTTTEERRLARELRRQESARTQEVARGGAAAVTRPPAARPGPPSNFHGFITASPSLVAAMDEWRRLAQVLLSVLISGESGTGKEVLARALHAESGRKGKFVSIHCGGIPQTLVEVELFGHARGAFTGADRDRSGLIEAAEGGTLFLDDVGVMPVEMQTALLRVLETGIYRRVSDVEERTVDVRVICATPAPVEGVDTLGDLRRDLYYRIAGAIIEIPPLRARREDVLVLAELFLQRYAAAGRSPPEIKEPLRTALLEYEWPGNVRELENLMRRWIALGDQSIDLASLRDSVDGASEQRATEIHSILNRAERDAILRALDRADGNKSKACKILGLSRKTFYRRLEKHGIPL